LTFIVYAPSIDETVSSFPENRQYFCQNVNIRPHTINNIVKTTDFDNNIDRVRSAYSIMNIAIFSISDVKPIWFDICL